jgi:hypothetical protein
MITQQYIDSFKQTQVFKILSEGLMQGDIEKVLLGQRPYRITSQYEMEDTDPYQVLITIHILILEGKLSSDLINQTLKNILITPKNICLMLSYLDNYTWYIQFHNELELDYLELLNRIKKFKPEYQKLPCFNNLITSIENNMARNQS